MENRLEDFVLNHREDFDIFEPSSKVWEKIETRNPEAKIVKANWTKYLWRAASVIVIFMISFAVSELIHRNEGQIAAKKNTASDNQEIQIPELVEAEIYYTSQVNDKLHEVQKHVKAFPELEHQLNYDMNELDSVLVELKQDLKDNIATEEVIDAMIQNYRLKLQVLEDILYHIQHAKGKLERNEHKYKI